MPNFVRWRHAGATYFFTVVSRDRQPILAGEQARRLLRHALVAVRAKLPFDTLACVLLPDHLHCIWALPEGDDDFPRRWRQIKERFTRRFLAAGGPETRITDQQRAEGRRGVWQSRYWEHRIRDDSDFLRHRDYVHLNPVKHGLVDYPRDWPWSSFHRYVALGWLDPDWPGSRPVELPDVVE